MSKPRKDKGQSRGEYSLRYAPFCVMCGYQFPSSRPDAKTGSNQCRVALSRWRKVYGSSPKNPPGRTASGRHLMGCCPPAVMARHMKAISKGESPTTRRK